MKTVPVTHKLTDVKSFLTFLEWCREMRFPYLSCDLFHSASFEIVVTQVFGSKYLSRVYANNFADSGNYEFRNTRVYALVRECDFALLAIYDPNITLGWRKFINRSMGMEE